MHSTINSQTAYLAKKLQNVNLQLCKKLYSKSWIYDKFIASSDKEYKLLFNSLMTLSMNKVFAELSNHSMITLIKSN